MDDYHYGVAPQALANLRVIAGRRAALDVTARQYFVSARGGFATGQRDRIFVGDASLAIRLYRRHALGLSYQLARRDSDFPIGRTRRDGVRGSARSTPSWALGDSARRGKASRPVQYSRVWRLDVTTSVRLTIHGARGYADYSRWA